MQKIKDKLKKSFYKLHNVIKKLLKNRKTAIILIFALILIVFCITFFTVNIIKKQIKERKELENKPLLEYETKEQIDDKSFNILIKINSADGLETVKYLDKDNKEVQLNCNGKHKLALDYVATDRKDYEFKIKINGQDEKTEVMHFEVPRIKGTYSLNNGIYVNEPDLSGYVKENTRYLYLNENGKLIPGNWITDEKPQNWYNYKEQNWANIYVESKGLESSYVWIPRYAYKQDTQNSISGNERMDVKFINTYNEYINPETNEVTTWEELKEQGYKIPEAFTWENNKDEPLIIPGYWMSKYQLSELGSDYKIDYNLQATEKTFNVNNFTNNVSTKASSYTYAINGKIVNTSTELNNYEFENANPEGENILNVTALDANGCIVGSMTKKFELTQGNEPDLSRI